MQYSREPTYIGHRELSTELWEVFDPRTGQALGICWSIEECAKSFKEWGQFGEVDARLLPTLSGRC